MEAAHITTQHTEWAFMAMVWISGGKTNWEWVLSESCQGQNRSSCQMKTTSELRACNLEVCVKYYLKTHLFLLSPFPRPFSISPQHATVQMCKHISFGLCEFLKTVLFGGQVFLVYDVWIYAAIRDLILSYSVVKNWYGISRRPWGKEYPIIYKLNASSEIFGIGK